MVMFFLPPRDVYLKRLPQVAESVLTGREIVEECEVEVQPNHVPSSCLDENVCIQKYFSSDAWSVLCNPVWYCGRCTK